MTSDPRADDLRALLAAYVPADDTEREHYERMLALLDDSDAPFSADSYAPGHFTASGFVLSPDGGALFFIHHRKLGRWLQPGGHVELDDASLLAAAQREVNEEIALAQPTLAAGSPGIFDIDIHPIPARKTQPGHAHFDVRFLFRAPSLDAVAASDETLGGRWFAIDEITAESTEASIARAVAKIGGS